MFGGLQFSTDNPTEERTQPDCFLPVAPHYGHQCGSYRDLDRQFLSQLPDESRFRSFTRVDLPSRKLPQSCQVLSGRTQTGEEFSIRVPNNSANHLEHDVMLAPSTYNSQLPLIEVRMWAQKNRRTESSGFLK